MVATTPFGFKYKLYLKTYETVTFSKVPHNTQNIIQNMFNVYMYVWFTYNTGLL